MDKMLIPDSIEPVEGWKVLEWGQVTGRLVSPMTCTPWPRGGKMVALCMEGKPHKAPHPLCRCGIYIVKSKLHAIGYARYNPVLVRVKGWGRVIPGEKGWRVERALPVEALIIGTLCERPRDMRKELIKAYDIPVKVVPLRQVCGSSIPHSVFLFQALLIPVCFIGGAINIAIGAIDSSILNYACGLLSILGGGFFMRRRLRRRP